MPNRNPLRKMAGRGEGEPTGEVRLLVEALSGLLWPLGRAERQHLLTVLLFSSSRFGTLSEFEQDTKESGINGIPALCGSRQNNASTFGFQMVAIDPALVSWSLGQRKSFQFQLGMSKQIFLGHPIGTSMECRPLRYWLLLVASISHGWCRCVRPSATSSAAR